MQNANLFRGDFILVFDVFTFGAKSVSGIDVLMCSGGVWRRVEAYPLTICLMIVYCLHLMNIWPSMMDMGPGPRTNAHGAAGSVEPAAPWASWALVPGPYPPWLNKCHQRQSISNQYAICTLHTPIVGGVVAGWVSTYPYNVTDRTNMY